MKRILLAGAIAMMCLSNAFAFEPFTVKDIRVEGIQRTEAGTVFSYLPVKVGETMTEEKATRSIKALFATGFFKDVRVEVDGDILVLVIEERPVIARIDFEGLKEFDKEQIIKGLKEAGFALSRPFDRSMLEQAEQELKRQYLTRGKYAMTVTTTVTPLERNRVGIDFAIEEGDSALIRQINIVGTSAFDKEDLLDLFQLQTPNWITWYTKNHQYSRQKLAADLETLRSFYMNRGFVEFNIVSTQVSISPDKEGIYITITLSEGERYVVSSVKVVGDLILPDDEFREAMQIKAGDIFSREAINESSKAIGDKLSRQGYAFANVNVSPNVDKEQRRVALTVFVDPGRRVYVRRINIGGNTRTRDEVIRQEVRQMENGWYDDERVKLSKQRIDKTDYFSEVTVETLPVPETTDQIDINYGVAEKTTGSITLGAGYSQSEKLILSGSISQANIFGSGKYASVHVSTGQINQAVGVSYNDPYFTVDGISQGFDIYHRKSDPRHLDYMYRTASTGAGIRFGIPLTERQSISLGASFDHTKVTIDRGRDMPVQYEQFIDKFCGIGKTTCSTLSVPLTLGWIYDGRDSAIDPRQGALHRIMYEISPGVDLHYHKATYQHQRYFPVTRRMTLMMNGEASYANGLRGQELPFFKNLYAGGVGSVRGWDTASLGPYEIDRYGNLVRLGGTRRFIFNAELLMPLPGVGLDKSFRFGPFFDAGQVYSERKIGDTCYPSSGNVCGQGPIRMSVGLTTAWLSPLGPLKFSLAYPLNRQKNDNIERFQFQIGTIF